MMARRQKTEEELALENLKLENLNYLKKCYEEYVRNDFLEAFEALYCASTMNDPYLNKIFKNNCDHDTNTEINYKHYEIAMYAKNIITWLDPKMNYSENSTLLKKVSQFKRFKTSFIHDEKYISRICLHNKCIDKPERKVTLLKNQKNNPPSSTSSATTSTSHTSSRRREVSEDAVIDNSQDNTMFMDTELENVDDNFKNKNDKSLTDCPKGEINMVCNIVNNTKFIDPQMENIDPNDNSKNKKAEDINKIFKEVENNISYIMDIPMENIDSENISSNINMSLAMSDVQEMTSTSESLKSNVVAIIEKNLDPVQSNSDAIRQNLLDLDLETSSSTVGQDFGSINKLSNTKLKFNNLSKTAFIRKEKSNSVITGSEHVPKKKKTEHLPVTHAVQNNFTHNVDNSVQTSDDSVKKLDDSTKNTCKNMYSRNKKGESKLHIACVKGNLELVTLLLGNGFNPNVKDNAGWTPLHEAIRNGHYLIVQKLINYGANLNVPGFEYESPLYTAIKYDKFDIASMLYHNGADTKCFDMYGISALSLNEEKWLQMIESNIPSAPSITKHVYESDQIVLYLYKISQTNAAVKKFCKQFNIKLVQDKLSETKHIQVTHIIIPETENNTCEVNLEILTGIANGLFLVNRRWIFDSLKQKKLLSCENYEVSGTTNYVGHNGPKISRINKQNLCPKLFDGFSIHISGNIGWQSFSLEQLKKLVLTFGAKLLNRMPNPEDCPTNIIPYHCRNNKEMYHVSTIVLFTKDSNRLIKFNMEHLKTFPISWFMEAVQKHIII